MPINPVLQDGKVVAYEVTVSENIGRRRYQRKRRFRCGLPEARKREVDLLQEVRKEAERGSRPTLGAWIDSWLESAKLTRKVSTIDAYRSTLQTNVPYELTSKPIMEVTPSDLHKLIFNPASELSPKTRENLLQCLKIILKAALFERLVPYNAAESIKISVPEPKLEAWTLGEVNHFLDEARKRNHPWFPIWAVTVFSGLRSGGAYALTWDNVDFENRRIYVVSNWTVKDGFHETKNRRNRVVPMNSQLAAYLVEHKAMPRDDVFVLPRLQEWTKGYQAKVLQAFANEIGLRQINFHALRASFITICMLQSVPTVKVQAMVGHQRLDTTMRYVRLVGADLDGATENIGMKMPQKERVADVIPFNPLRR